MGRPHHWGMCPPDFCLTLTEVDSEVLLKLKSLGSKMINAVRDIVLGEWYRGNLCVCGSRVKHNRISERMGFLVDLALTETFQASGNTFPLLSCC